jgi:hypothetical protein
MNEFPDIRGAVRDTLERNGFQPAPLDREPNHSIPVRYWPDPNTMFLGYLDVWEDPDGGYEMTFRVAPLHGQKPKYELRAEVARR